MIPQIVAAEAVSKASSNKATPYIVGGVILLVGGLAIYVTVKWLEFIQVKDTREERKENKYEGKETAKLDFQDAFNPSRSRNQPSKITITQQNAEILAETIHRASGWVRCGVGGAFCDDYEADVTGAVRQAGTSYNLSKVSDVFFKKYKTGLLDHIYSFNSDESFLTQLNEIVDNYKS